MNREIDRVSKWGVLSLVGLFAVSGLMAQSVPATESPKYPSFRIGGFAGLELHTSSDNRREGLDLVEIDLYPTAQFSDRWSALAEVVALRDLRPSTTETGRRPLLELDLERLFVAYEPTDLLRIEVGETHTGIVRWNEREHRSRLLQTPIDVPAIARPPQDDGAWPLRFVGLWLSGRSKGPLGFRYGLALGNGSGTVRDSIPIFGRDRSTAGLLSLSIEPARWHGLELAVAGYAQRIPTAEPLHERDVTFSTSYVNRGTEVRTEWAQMLHTAVHSRKRYRSTGYYVLASQRLGGRLARLRPYVLIDRLSLAPGEAYLRDARDENAWAGGLRYDLTGHFTLKTEFRSQRGQ
ncbi:MAG TPA: hypothetical protein VHL58_04175, partial [Thermoanaerobaculia bacterium]|nr:hypothetical protein [Thermoanaerobaculia bacterium]